MNLSPAMKRLLARVRRRGVSGLSPKEYSGRLDSSMLALARRGLVQQWHTIEGPVWVTSAGLQAQPKVSVKCDNCESEERVRFAFCLKRGWPKCCGETMRLMTQPSQETVDAAVAACVLVTLGGQR